MFVILFNFITPISVSLVSLFDEFMSIDGEMLVFLSFLQEFLQHVVHSQRQGGNACKFNNFVGGDEISHDLGIEIKIFWI